MRWKNTQDSCLTIVPVSRILRWSNIRQLPNPASSTGAKCHQLAPSGRTIHQVTGVPAPSTNSSAAIPLFSSLGSEKIFRSTPLFCGIFPSSPARLAQQALLPSSKRPQRLFFFAGQYVNRWTQSSEQTRQPCGFRDTDEHSFATELKVQRQNGPCGPSPSA